MDRASWRHLTSRGGAESTNRIRFVQLGGVHRDPAKLQPSTKQSYGLRKSVKAGAGSVRSVPLLPAAPPPAGWRTQIVGVPDVRRQLRKDRSRIARDLHDDLGQTLTALKLGLDAIGAAINRGENADEVAARLANLTQEVQGATANLRRVILDLRPAALERLGLPAAIEAQAFAFRSRTGISCYTHGLECASRLCGAKAKAAFRFIGEALTNVARHAEADEVVIEISHDTERVSLCVKDNGRGMNPVPMANAPALGLIGTRERASQLGGRLTISAASPHGCVLRLDLPF